jgi:thiol-disulfide isomerase/thioredoxin
MKQTALMISAAIIALGLGLFSWHFFAPAKPPASHPLPDFSLLDLSDQQHSITEWQGKVLVINFWATWCPPCLKEIPDFVALQKQLADQDVQFIGIALDDKESVVEFTTTTKINYPILLGGDNGIALTHQLGNNVDAVPYTIIVDREGLILEKHPGEFSKEKILEVITPLMK